MGFNPVALVSLNEEEIWRKACIQGKSESVSHSVASDSCAPMDCSLLGSSVRGVLQARILEWVAISYCRESSWLGDQTCVPCISCIGRWILYWLTHQTEEAWFLDQYSEHISSVQFSRSVVSDSLRPHESQHARPPCPSPNPRVHSGSRPPSQWCHPAISSSVVPFFSCPQSLPASKPFPMSQPSYSHILRCWDQDFNKQVWRKKDAIQLIISGISSDLL